MMDYHWRPFGLLHEDLRKGGYNPGAPHQQRKTFWGLVPPRQYESPEARPLLLQYARVVEEKIAKIVEGSSVAYWLHLYRRLAPFPIVERESPVTVAITRAVLEAALEKYGCFEPCSRVGLSTEIGVSKILGGLLESPEFEFERRLVLSYPQIVLADFSVNGLAELYDAEKLAFEVWRTGAQLRCVGKGAGLRVNENEERVADSRSDELDKLVMRFDERNMRAGITASASGTVFARSESPPKGMVLLPTYNASAEVLDKAYNEYFTKAFGFKLAVPWRPNFIWVPFDLRSYYRAHEPLAPGFAETHGVGYHSVMAVLASLLFRVLKRATLSRGETLISLWQKAYEGPYAYEYVVEELRAFSPAAKQLLEMPDAEWHQVDLDAGLELWKLREGQRAHIDLAYPGPHSILLPYGKDRVFIDYAWIARRLYDFFIGVSIPDQNFKGTALEEVVRGGSSVLPISGCLNLQGEQRQIDAAFRVGNRLVIAECRAVGRSIGFDRGDPDAIRFRQQLVERTLDDVDDKARWLARAMKGRNYDISWAEAIVPVGVTPFVEFVPSLSPRYWLSDALARVLTPRELRDALDDGSMTGVMQNVVPAQRSV